MFCSKCGTEINEEDIFCPKCGNKRKGSNLDVKQTDSSLASEEYNSIDTGISVKKKTNKLPFIISAIAVVIVVVIVAFVNLFSGTGSSHFSNSDDVTIIATSVSHGYGYLSIKNTGNNVIRDVKIAIKGFDSNGFLIPIEGNEDYVEFDIPSVNLLAGKTYGPVSKWLSSDVKYIDAVVTHITYMDNKEWSVNADSWTSDFSIDSRIKQIEDMRENAISAENNPYLKIVSSEKWHGNKFDSSQNISITVKNIGDKPISTIYITVMEYDENGYPLNVNKPGYAALPNADKLKLDFSVVDAGDTQEYEAHLFFMSDCKDYVLLVSSIDFTDGTTWNNENTLPWIIYNEFKR